MKLLRMPRVAADRWRNIRHRIRLLQAVLQGPNPSPILIFGNTKSGTSAICHLLAHLGGLTKTVDIPELWHPVNTRILEGQVSFERVLRTMPHRFLSDVIKEPSFTFFAEQVLDAFPLARPVFVIRDPRDNIRSMLNRLRLPGDVARLDLRTAGVPSAWMPMFESPAWGGVGVSDGCVPHIELLAQRWVRTSAAYLEHSRRFHLVKYEDFVVDKVGQIEELAAKLRVEKRFDLAGMENVQFQPAGDNSASWLAYFGADNVADIERICRREMALLGYRPS